MPWVKATDKYSKGWQLCRIIGDTNKFPAKLASNVIADFSGKTYEKDQIEWLDTEEPSFSISDMKKCWDICDDLHTERSGYCLPANYFNKFMKEKYDIDITK